MSWVASIVGALLTGAAGLFVAGFVAALCASWYRMSNFEGASGYFVVLTAILGGIVSFFIGLIVARLVGSGSGLSFLKATGISWGLVVGIAGVTAAIAFLLADVPPRIDGRYLKVEVEIRLPVGETNAPAKIAGESSLVLGSVVNHVQRKSKTGELKVKEARLENGRWVIPGSVHLFTRRGKRSIAALLGGKSVAGFIVPLPRCPGKRFEQWSEWEPRPRTGSWPDTNPSYRFRVQEIVPPPPEPDPAAVEAAEFAALKADAPLDEWLSFIKSRSSEERVKAVMKVVEGRQAELASLIRSTNGNTREAALTAVPWLTKVEPEISEAVLADGRDIAEEVRRFKEMKSDEPQFLDEQVRLRSRFNYWKQAWWTVHRRLGLDGRPPVKEIRELAAGRAKDTTMDEIVVNADAILNALEPATK